MIGTRLFVLRASVFVVMVGFGFALPVLPSYVERLALFVWQMNAPCATPVRQAYATAATRSQPDY